MSQNRDRASGVLLHITSLPSKFGIGDLGPAAYDFADKLAAAKQKFWQILPLNPTDTSTGNSPYSSASAFAGNVLLISPELLKKEGLLSEKDISNIPNLSEDKVDFKKVEKYKQKLLKKAFKNFLKEEYKNSADFEGFKIEHQHWLQDFSLFFALKIKYKTANWLKWPVDLKNRKAIALRKATQDLAGEIEEIKFQQFLFFQQWQQLKDYCNEKEIGIIGDMPFYVDHHSADVWANPGFFKLDKDKKPTAVSGVPPDYFSETGQLWGTPVFDWQRLKRKDYSWWLNRIQQNLNFFDLLRLDHFRAFTAYWEVPAGEKTAINGKYQPGPAHEFFNALKMEFPGLPFIAEDLGDIDQPVRDLMRDYNLPGMKVLQFAFGKDIGSNQYIIHNHSYNSIVYTGTHDNKTTVGWYRKEGSSGDKKRISKYSGKKVTKKTINEILIKMAMMSVAQLAVIPLQDILGLDEKATMNRPGSASGNWEWRAIEKQINSGWEKQLKKWTELYGRK